MEKSSDVSLVNHNQFQKHNLVK